MSKIFDAYCESPDYSEREYQRRRREEDEINAAYELHVIEQDLTTGLSINLFEFWWPETDNKTNQ